MESSEREDYLEAVLVRHLAAQAHPTAKDLAEDLSVREDIIVEGVTYLEQQGDIVLGENGAISLTARGHHVANRVLKKHRVLQCFLGEILGMDDHTASDEACVLEHTISDTTINRIGDYVKSAGSRRGEYGGNGTSQTLMTNQGPNNPADHLIPGGKDAKPLVSSPGPTCSSLLDAPESIPLTVVGITGGEYLHRLIDLGVIPGEEVILKRRLHNNAVVLQVKKCDIALSPEIAGTILVENS